MVSVLKAHSFTLRACKTFVHTSCRLVTLLTLHAPKQRWETKTERGCLAALASKQAASTAKLQHNAFAHGGAAVAMAQSCTAQ